jgi:hypothetical protein
MASPNARRPDAALTASRPPNDLRAGIATANKSLQAERQAEAPDFENPPAAKSSSGDSQNLKFERADWSLFRTIEGLSQKAGVPPDKLPRLVLKEIADNGLDAGARVKVGALPGGAYFVEDDGPGIDGTPEAIARLFSISRPMISTKLIRLPMRGALGNGLRVVAGAVLASGGSLTVITRNRRIKLRPEADGTTRVIGTKAVEFPVGTRVEIAFGPALPCNHDTLGMARTACHLARGQSYSGKSSPWWYDVPNFHELFLGAAANLPVRELISRLDGCSGSKAGEIVTTAGINRAICSRVTRAQAEKLLLAARADVRQVNPQRLGAIGPELYGDNAAYGYAQGIAKFGTIRPQAEIPFNVEAWAARAEKTYCTACVNRTPISGTLNAGREKRDIDLFGCGLANMVAKAPATANFTILFNVITPYMPITSDGKAPNLRPFLHEIAVAISKAVRKAHRPDAGNKLSQKGAVIDNLEAVIADVSGDGQFRFNARQLFYGLRPLVMDETGEELKIGNFTTIITDYEAERGEIPGMYREPRGSIYHPHKGQTITLGTLMVEEYERPAWIFNKLVYIEKEGFTEALKDDGWPERHDCAPMSSKGFTTRAARDLVDKLAEHDEPVTIFCVHDADAYGTMIYQTFQEATKARGARKIKIANLGLEPWEAIEMGLEVETVEAGTKRKAVADYVKAREDQAPGGSPWEEWLQTHRVELNAMTTPEFIDWLDRKMAEHGSGKLIPPDDVVAAELEARLAAKVRASITERILREAGLEEQVAEALDASPASLRAAARPMESGPSVSFVMRPLWR